VSAPRESALRVREVLETCVYASDLEAAERFYAGVLGLEVLGRVAGRHVFFRLGRGVFLVFDPDATSVAAAHGLPVPTHGARGPGHVAFAVPDAALDGWRERLARLGVAVEAEVAWPRGGRSLYVRDPAGNSVELAAPRIWGLPDEVAGADPAPGTGHSPGMEP
jgi:catechol 2,3-dioxygenase-like lactoylglutathione lyase family enzyme